MSMAYNGSPWRVRAEAHYEKLQKLAKKLEKPLPEEEVYRISAQISAEDDLSGIALWLLEIAVRAEENDIRARAARQPFKRTRPGDGADA